MKKYIAKQNGYIMIHGSPCELKIGQSVSKLVYDNYPNFVDEVELGFNKLPEIKEPIVEQKSEPVILNEEPNESVVPDHLPGVEEYIADHPPIVPEIPEQEIVDELTEAGIENMVESVMETINEEVSEPVIEQTPEVTEEKRRGRPKAGK